MTSSCLRIEAAETCCSFSTKTRKNFAEILGQHFSQIWAQKIRGKILSWSIILANLPDLATVEVLAMIPGDAVCNGSNGCDLRSWGGFKWISFQRGMQQLHCPI